MDSESKAWFRTLTKNVPVGLFWADPHGGCLYVNERWCEIVGLTPEEACGEGWVQGLHPADRERVCTEWYQSAKNREPFQSEYRFQRGDGSTRWVLGQAVADKDAAGEVRGYIGTVTDITAHKLAEQVLVNVYSEFEQRGQERTAVLVRINDMLRKEIEERQRAEHALREAEGKYRSIVENTVEGIFQTTPAGRFISANPAMARLLGYTSPQELMASITSIEHQLYVNPEHFYALRRLFEERDVVQGFETQVYRKDRSTIWVSINARALRDVDGTVYRFEGTVEDITERKQMEEQLRESHHFLHTIIEGMADALFVKDLKGRYLMINAASARFFGQPAGEIIGKEDTAFFPPETARQIRENDRRVISTGEALTCKDQSIVNGILRTALTSKTPYRDYQGHVLGLIGIARDITEWEQAEDQLRENEERFRKLFKDAPIGMALVGSDYMFLNLNDAFCKMVGYTEQELMRRSFIDITHPDDVEKDVHLAGQVFAEEIPGYRLEKRYIKKGGEVIWIDLTATVIRNHEGKPLYGLAMIEDITERKRTEEQLRESREQLRALAMRLESVREEERARIAREIHDELGQVLTGLKMDIAWLNNQLVGTDNGTSSYRCREKLDSMSELIDSTIRSVRRIVTELRPGILDSLGLLAAVEWAAQTFQTRMGIRCQCTVPGEVAVDQTQSITIFRILQEALTNVARHAQASRVTIRLSKRAGTLRLEVKDNGKGMTEGDIDDTHALGLFGMRERARLLGGDLDVQTALGKGTTVRVRIPLVNHKGPKRRHGQDSYRRRSSHRPAGPEANSG